MWSSLDLQVGLADLGPECKKVYNGPRLGSSLVYQAKALNMWFDKVLEYLQLHYCL